MTTIILGTDKSEKDRYVVAETLPSANAPPDHRKGNVDALAGTKIAWHAVAGGPVSMYTVTFTNLSDGTMTWPFVERADGEESAEEGYLGPLTLEPNKEVELTTKPGVEGSFKYVVKATPNNDKTIQDLDPVIIIRPALRSSVSNSLSWAVAGAAVGALITWALLGGER